MPTFKLFRRALLTLIAALAVAACSTNPDTGKSQLNLLSQQEEVTLGEEAQPDFIAGYGGEVPSERIKQYVTEIGHCLAEQTHRPDLPWEFHVVDSAVINAFALPGGKVFISRALLALMDNEAQLAGVLGHEVGHVAAKHINDRMANALGLNVLLAGVGVASQYSDQQWLGALGVGAQLGGTVYLLKYGRDQEHESDSLGLRYMVACGYNPVGQVQVMQILESASGGAGGVEWLSTHPNPGNRVQRLQNIIRKDYPHYENDPEGFFADRFAQNVKAELQKLPPPKHTGEEQATAALHHHDH